MGWDFGDDGMKLVLTPEVPRLARERLRPVAEDFLRRQGLGLGDVRHWLLHPGGLRVIEAYEEAFGLSPEGTRWSRRCLERNGNLSSASVLFMLEDLLASGEARPGDYGLLLALGPGFAAEMLLLRWD
jgi:alkylresorcinol/alkylpyrone synthase